MDLLNFHYMITFLYCTFFSRNELFSLSIFFIFRDWLNVNTFMLPLLPLPLHFDRLDAFFPQDQVIILAWENHEEYSDQYHV